jgi:uncharacterized protein YutE (UPF0331/DUF86 family)
MIRFEKNRVQKLISSMRQSLALLSELAALPDDVFFSDVHKQSSAKYNFITAIESAIDLANHIISKNSLRAPNDYADVFIVLSEAGIIDKDFSKELAAMARFRNRLVHLYWDIDVKQLQQILKTRIIDFSMYLKMVGNHIDIQ